MRRRTSTRTSSVSSSSFFRIKNSYRKSVRTSSTGSSSGASSISGRSVSSGSEEDFDADDLVDEDEEEGEEDDDDDVIGLEDFGDMYINEAADDQFDGAILKQILNKREPVRITLKLQVTETTFSVWETVRSVIICLCVCSFINCRVPVSFRCSTTTRCTWNCHVSCCPRRRSIASCRCWSSRRSVWSAANWCCTCGRRARIVRI